MKKYIIKIISYFIPKHVCKFELVTTIGAWWKNEDRYYRCKCGKCKIVYWGGYTEFKAHVYGKTQK